MKVTTVYTPIDTNGQPFNLKTGLYTLSDVQNMATGLTAAGVGPTDALRFAVDAQGVLTIESDKTV